MFVSKGVSIKESVTLKEIHLSASVITRMLHKDSRLTIQQDHRVCNNIWKDRHDRDIIEYAQIKNQTEGDSGVTAKLRTVKLRKKRLPMLRDRKWTLAILRPRKWRKSKALTVVLHLFLKTARKTLTTFFMYLIKQ